MDALVQELPGIIGSAAHAESLARSQKARVLVLSDSHGRVGLLERAVRASGPECDALVFCGDGVSDLLCLLEKSRDDPSLAACVPQVVCPVEGNCDTPPYGLCGALVQVALIGVLPVAGHRILVTHGHRFSLYNGIAPLERAAARDHADIVLHGHTHVAAFLRQGGLAIANPGSCAKPRQGQLACYGVLTVQNGTSALSFDVLQLTATGSAPYLSWSGE